MTRIISISDEAYDRLKRVKGKQSFTKAILSLTEEKKPSMLDYAGIWEHDDEMKEIFDEVLSERHKVEERDLPSW